MSSSNDKMVAEFADDALRSLATTFSNLSGEEFFYRVAKYLAQTLDMRYSLIGEIETGKDRVVVLGGSENGQPMQLPFEYDLAGTPCQDVFRRSFCIHKSRVAERYPNDILLRDMAVESYAGVPLFDRRGDRLGIIVVMDEKPIVKAELAESLLAIFADTVSAEIQRRNSAVALQKSESLLRDVGRMAAVGGWELDVKTLELSWTEETCRIHEVPLDHTPELDQAINYYHPDDRPGLEAVVQGALEHGEPYDTEFRLITAKGNERWTRSICRPLVEDGKTLKLIGTFQDITRRRRYEERLRRYEHMVASSADLLALLDTDFNYLAANDAYANALGKNTDELIGHNAKELLGIEYFESVVRANGRRCLSGEETQHQTWFDFPQGGRKYIDVQYSPYRVAGGKIEGFLITARDITLREELRSQLAQAQKMESIGKLAGGIAHDFNSMLGVILGIAELALERTDASEPLRADLAEIHKVAQKSASLTQQLLAFARKQTIAPKVLDLNDIMGETLEMIRRLIGENIDLRWCPGIDLWPIHMDPSQIDQILSNLCVNARDAIEDVGQLRIETSNACFDDVFCADNPGFTAGNFVCLSVADNGQGMDDETMSRLYEPFYTSKKSGSGTGLGLATVYGIVKQNDGFIDVVSTVGQGTAFSIYLPRYKGVAPSLPRQADIESVKQGAGVVLIAEDQAELLKLARVMLERCGYTVLTASTPSDALRVATAHKSEIDLLLTDVIMPEMNGRNLAMKIADLCPGIKTLFMSGHAADVVADNGKLYQGTNFLQKPFTKRRLADAVAEALSNE